MNGRSPTEPATTRLRGAGRCGAAAAALGKVVVSTAAAGAPATTDNLEPERRMVVMLLLLDHAVGTTWSSGYEPSWSAWDSNVTMKRSSSSSAFGSYTPRATSLRRLARCLR